jgi:hypothetical protein
MNLNSQPNVLSAKITLEIDKDESIQTVLHVVTDLVLDIQNEKFNSSALDDLTDNIIATMRQNTSIDRATVSN